jgi:ketosteroid isomerase-like protein
MWMLLVGLLACCPSRLFVGNIPNLREGKRGEMGASHQVTSQQLRFTNDFLTDSLVVMEEKEARSKPTAAKVLWHAELCGSVMALVVFVWVLKGSDWVGLGCHHPKDLFFILATTAGLTGWLAVATRRWSGLPDPITKALAVRLGLRAGWVAVGMGGGLAVLALTLREKGYVGNQLAQLSALFGSGVVLMSLVPGVFIAVFAAMAHVTPTSGRLLAEVPEKPVSRWRRLTPYLTLLAIFGLMSPVIIQQWKSQQAAVPDPKPAPSKPLPKPTSPPSFAYSKPDGFDQAPVHRWDLVAHQTISPMDWRKPMAIAPNGQFLVYCRGDQAVIRDLHSEQETASFALSDPSALAWSPESDRVFYTESDNSAYVGVLDIAQQRTHRLPIPKGEWVPMVEPLWWANEEVLFFTSPDYRFLNLDTLRVKAIDRSTAWSGLSENEQKAFSQRPPLRLPRQNHWQLKAWLPILSYQTRVDSELPLLLGMDHRLAVADEKAAYVRVFLDVPMQVADRVLASTDGSKFIRVHDGQAEVHYFGLKAAATRTLTLTVKARPNDLSQDLVDRLDKQQLHAFVADPLINPLNNKVVGANMNAVKALVRIQSWVGTTLTVSVAEAAAEVTAELIVADVHFWTSEGAFLIDEMLGEDWWSEIDSISSQPPGNAPELTREPSESLVDVRRSNGLFLERQLASASNTRAAPKTTQPEVTPRPSTTTALTAAEKSSITTFIQAHHRKATLRDLDGFASDYAALVEFFKQGRIARSVVRKDQADYQDRWPRISENIMGTIAIELNGRDIFATYDLSLFLESDDGTSETIRSRVTLGLARGGQGWKITSQDADRIK